MNATTVFKSATIGLLGSLVMFVLMQIGLGLGVAPFELPPSAAFLIRFDIPPKPLALIGHFLYGAFWSIILVLLFKKKAGVGNGIGLSIFLWLIMMLIISPMIGWGIFGMGELPNDPIYQEVDGEKGQLFLEGGPQYAIVTLVLHLIYGITIGLGDRKWSVRSMK